MERAYTRVKLERENFVLKSKYKKWLILGITTQILGCQTGSVFFYGKTLGSVGVTLQICSVYLKHTNYI